MSSTENQVVRQDVSIRSQMIIASWVSQGLEKSLRFGEGFSKVSLERGGKVKQCSPELMYLTGSQELPSTPTW